MNRRWALALFVASGCRSILGIDDPTFESDDAPSDVMPHDTGSGSDAPAATCLDKWHDGTVQLSTPSPVLDSGAIITQIGPWVSDDELELWFNAEVAGQNRSGIFRATRGTTAAMFANPVERTDLDNGRDNIDISLTPDLLTAVVGNQDRTDGPGLPDLFLATRASTSANFGTPSPTPLGGVDTVNFEFDSHISRDGLRIYFSREPKSGGSPQPAQINFASRASTSAAFGTPTVLGFGGDYDSTPAVSRDETIIFWSRGTDAYSMFYATRPDTSATFGSPISVPIGASTRDDGPFLSADSCTLYFSRFDGNQTTTILASHVIL
ncbi:MAG TPA: hypothetical protein VGM39_03850 [Kofleriaceae bacterium]|jgi:hypothetical protein